VEFNGLDFSQDGTLWMVNGDPRVEVLGDVYTVDPATGAPTKTGSIGTMARHGDFDPGSDLYYGVGGDRHGFERHLMVVDMPTATVMEVLPDLPDDVHVVTFIPGRTTRGLAMGAGWIDSPAGAYALAPRRSGKAHFAFTAKYPRDSTTPVGRVRFLFLDGLLTLQGSTNALDLSPGNARIRGSGRINWKLAPNGKEYQFTIWAGDGTPDTFRMRIWYNGLLGQVVVYDNGDRQPLGGGNIKVKY